MKKLLLILWQLPQDVIGVIVFLFCKTILRMKLLMCAKVYVDEHKNVVSECYIFDSDLGGAVSFGKIILMFCRQKHIDSGAALKLTNHEYGHSVQSVYLGWLYLLVIGLPSLIVTSISSSMARQLYTEKWAERIVENIEVWTRRI